MNKTYGLLAEFSTHEKLIHAAEEAYEAGFRKMDGFAPFAVEGLAEALGKKNRLPLMVLIGGIVGGVGGYFMEWYRERDQLSDQHWRPPDSQLARVHSNHI